MSALLDLAEDLALLVVAFSIVGALCALLYITGDAF